MGREKKTTTTFHRRSTLAKRRHEQFTVGKGSSGLMVKLSRCVRFMRKVCAEVSPSFRAMVGNDSDAPVRIYKKAVKVVAGGVDAYMNLVMATAYEIADPEGKRKNAIQLQPYHLEKAQKLIKKFTSK